MLQDLKKKRIFTYTSSNEEIDPVNIRVLEELQHDPRLTMSELGRRIGMSSPAVTERVRRLEEAGVIRGYRLDLNPVALGLPLLPTFASARTPDNSPGSQNWPSRFPKSSNVTASPAKTASF